MTSLPLSYRFLFTGPMHSARTLSEAEWERLWSNLGWALTPPDDPPEVHRRCKVCDATWVGPVGEACWWCERRSVLLIEGQRTLLLCEPEVDVLDAHDKEIQRAGDAWAERLAVGVEAELLAPHEADEAVKVWLRKVTRWRNP